MGTVRFSRRNPPAWLVLLACCGCAAGAIGICLNSVGVFYGPVTQELGFSRGAFAFHATLSSITTGLLCPVAAILFQKLPVRLLMTTGVLLAVASTAAMATADSLWLFYLFGFVRGLGCTLFASTPLTMIIGHWFTRRHGAAIGVVFSFSGIAGAFFSPWFSHLIAQNGWRSTHLVMAVCLAAVSLPGALLLRASPSGKGTRSDEATGLMDTVAAHSGEDTGAAGSETMRIGEETAQNGGEAGRFPVFSLQFLMTGCFIVLSISITGVAQHFPGYAQTIDRTAQFGATMLSAAMIGNIAFKLLIGVLSDRMGPVRACTLMGIINASSLLMLLVAGNHAGTAGLYLLSFLFGAIYSVGAVGIPLVIRHLYGSAQYVTAFGYAGALVSIGGAFSLTTIGYLYDWTGSYRIALLVAIGSGISGLLLLQVIHRMHRAGRPHSHNSVRT